MKACEKLFCFSLFYGVRRTTDEVIRPETLPVLHRENRVKFSWIRRVTRLQMLVSVTEHLETVCVSYEAPQVTVGMP